MNRIFYIFLLACVSYTCSYAQENEATETTATISNKEAAKNWDELFEYHEVMAATFHPAETGDLAPLKEQASDLKEYAIKWASSDIPENFVGTDIEWKLGMLEKNSIIIAQSVEAGKSDEDLTKKIYELHDLFHEIVDQCFHE